MFHVRDEGGVMRRGFNFYPLRNRYNRGFVFALGKLRFQVRWSRVQGRILWGRR